MDRRADIYSLGATLLALLIGSNPNGGSPRPDGGTTTVRDHPERTPTRIRPAIPPALDDVIARAMAADPERRYPTCLDFARAVERAIADPERRWAVTDLVRRPRLVLLGGIAAAMVAAIATTVSLWPESADRALPATAPHAVTGPAVSQPRRCYWRVRIPIGDDLYVEVPSGTADHDDPQCLLNDGDRGDSVVALRQALAMCHRIDLAGTSVYDTAMKRAIRHLQTDHNAAVAGIYGPETRAKAMQWPVFRVAGGTFDGRCVSMP